MLSRRWTWAWCIGAVLLASGCAGVKIPPIPVKIPIPVGCEQFRLLEATLCPADAAVSAECLAAREAAKACPAPTTPPPVVTPVVPPPVTPPPVVPPPVTPPPAVTPGARFPQGLPESAFHQVPGATPTMGEKVNAAVRTVTGQDGGRIVIRGGPQAYFARVTALLRERGISAGQHAEGVTDEIAVRNADGDWEGYHVYAGEESNTPETMGTALLSPPAFRGAYRIEIPPAEPVYACAPPTPLRTYEDGTPHYAINSHPYGGGAIIDSTPVVVGQWEFCKSIGLGYMGDPALDQRRASCPVRPDMHPQRVACERYLLGGPPVMDSNDGQACQQTPGNEFQFYPRSGHCRICDAARTVCSERY